MERHPDSIKEKPASASRQADEIRRSPKTLRLVLGLFIVLLALDGGVAFYSLGWDVPAGNLLKQLAAARPRAAAWIPPANPTETSPAPTLPLAAPGNSPKTAAMVAAMLQPSLTPFQPAAPTATFSPTTSAKATASPSPIPQISETHTPLPAPQELEASPTAMPPLPDSAMVKGLYGVNQALPLSCESRSAADWAHFFGYSVNELEFQNSLPKSDNPATGFVGNPRGDEGQIPPRSYGVYAGPVAQLLRDLGVPARAYEGLGFDDIRREIAAGKPVIVWVVGAVEVGLAVDYTASDGQTVPVVRMEHTVMVAGYTPNAVYIQDGSYRYVVSIQRFRKSWGALGNQAIFAP